MSNANSLTLGMVSLNTGLEGLFSRRPGREAGAGVKLPFQVSSPRPELESAGPQDLSADEYTGYEPEAQSLGGAEIEVAPVALPAVAALTPLEVDRASVARALTGDQSAFAEIVERYQGAVFNLAYRMLGDASEAEDAAQEVFVRAWKQLHTYQPERRFSTWLLSIASHYCIDMLRRRKPSAPLDDVALFIESDDPQPDELVMRDEQSATVKKLLDTLPDKYRSVTVLRYYNDLSYDEIAQATGLSESAVKTQLHRARKMLADKLAGGGGEYAHQR